jgi:hypothetical protein
VALFIYVKVIVYYHIFCVTRGSYSSFLGFISLS